MSLSPSLFSLSLLWLVLIQGFHWPLSYAPACCLSGVCPLHVLCPWALSIHQFFLSPYPGSECVYHFMPIHVQDANSLPLSSPLSLLWGVCLPREAPPCSVSDFPYQLSASTFPHAWVSLCIFPSLSNLFLPLPAIHCPGTLGEWGSGFFSLSAQALRSWFSQRWTHQAGPRLGTAVASPPSAIGRSCGKRRVQLFQPGYGARKSW